MPNLNLKWDNYSNKRIGYFVYADGIDKLDGQTRTLVLQMDPSVSGCSPFYWEISVSGRPGKEFSDIDSALSIANQSARETWDIKSIDTESIIAVAIEITDTKTMKVIDPST